MKHLVAIDIGTQSSRAAVLTQDGAILGIEQIPHDIDSPKPNWAQQNPNAWWDETCQALQAVLRETAVDPASIAAVATCGQMHGPVGLDENGLVTTDNVQLWCDKRCQPQCDALVAGNDPQALMRRANNPVGPAWTGIKVKWIQDNEPDAFARSRWFLVPKDFINYRLTGIAAADPSEASCSYLYDATTDNYSPQLAQTLGLDLRCFAPIHASHEVIGTVTEQAAAATNLPAGTPVVAGGGDFPVSMLGFGIVGEGVTADVTGTSTLLATHTDKPLLNTAIQNLRHVVPGWIPFTILDCGGLSMKWCKDLASSMRGEPVSYDELIELARQAPPGCQGLQFYPYLLGERRAENIAARGGFFGLTLPHQAPHFVRAVMEGVALSMGKDLSLFRELGRPCQRLLSVGGGTKNALWNQIKASVVQMPLELADEPEAGLKGAAILAAAGVGLIADPVQTALERRATPHAIQPDPDAREAYETAQREFNRTYEHMRGYWPGQPS